MKYNNHLNYKKRKRFLLKVRLFMLAFFVILLLAGAFYYFKNYYEPAPENNNAVSGQTVTSVAPSVNIFRSPYYQFQTPEGWVEVTKESTSNKIVYRGLKSNLIEHYMEIYIDQIPADLEATRAMPVTISKDKTSFIPGEVSNHCVGKDISANTSIFSKDVKVKDTTIRCDFDGQTFTVLIGATGGNTVLKMIRPDGTDVSFSIYYMNLKANPDTSVLKGILETFQTR